MKAQKNMCKYGNMCIKIKKKIQIDVPKSVSKKS